MTKFIMVFVAVFGAVLIGRPGQGFMNLRGILPTSNDFTKPIRTKRTIEEHHVTDCIHMTSEEGEFYHKALSVDGQACGIYIYAEPNQNIEIRFNYLDVPCENGGLVSVVDGWELKGEFFPSSRDHQKPLRARFNEFCGERKIKKVFTSSQNVALIQYRMPARGTSFSFTVRFVKNPTPCNVFFQADDHETIYTLHNYGRRTNCSLSTLFPASVSIEALNVGVTPVLDRGIQQETGTIHKVSNKLLNGVLKLKMEKTIGLSTISTPNKQQKNWRQCQKRGLEDYVEVGGSLGLDNKHLQVADSFCGLNSTPGRYAETIACDTTTVRLVSSGAFDNSVTIKMRQLTDNDIDGHLSVVCFTDDMLQE
ncbi:corticotropin-releasing factor-binding protein isoform X2 [Diabrotica virgifera virgifera]|uniref:Corticotropin-releasing factor-binding protein n=1 Tax=Diabrotica virgifera virgifera TaxID=50390 RepID=A0ABM5K338_DIAVI|nr:corticotropin-releasing factor-binding protein isoform X2 [Diabrotica virgifera virgifera]